MSDIASAATWSVPDDDFVARLADEREATLRRLDSLERDFDDIAAASVNSNADDEHDPEGSTIAFERSQVSALIEQAKRHLVELDAAQSRLVRSTYGQCESCAQPIGVARLEARPVARTCIGCATPKRRP